MTLVAPPLTLSALLREGTREVHAVAESAPFIERLMAGTLDVAAYAGLAAQQHAIYVALEAAHPAMKQDERGATLVFDELERVPAIEADLEHLYGPAWRDDIEILPATRAYAARLAEVGTRLPEYAAHAYTRYLGDLSGGQVIKTMMQRHYAMGDAGLAFYDFPGIGKAKPFKDLYRERLDGLALGEAETERAVAEAREAFLLNRAVFADLGERHL